MEELAAKAEKQHLENVEVPTDKSWRAQDVVADAADATPERMSSFAQSKMCSRRSQSHSDHLAWSKISTTTRCETTAIRNPSKFASCATRLGLHLGFPVDLTIASPNGTKWDCSLEDCRAELRRVQKRELPELLAGSPPSDDFSSLLKTCVKPKEISKLKTKRIEPQIRALCTSLPALMELQKHFVHDHLVHSIHFT